MPAGNAGTIMELHTAGRIGGFGKRLAPALARVADGERLRNPTRLVAIYLDILQGKGSGIGWDMMGEMSAALSFIDGVKGPIIFDIGANHGKWTRKVCRALGVGGFFAYEPQTVCQASQDNSRVPGLTVTQSAVPRAALSRSSEHQSNTSLPR